jgi:hypothetical protein
MGRTFVPGRTYRACSWGYDHWLTTEKEVIVKIILWIIGVIFLIGLLVVFGVLDFIF